MAAWSEALKYKLTELGRREGRSLEETQDKFKREVRTFSMCDVPGSSGENQCIIP